MSDPSSSQPVRVTHEAWCPSDLFEKGIGWVIVARFKSGGRRVESGIFLIDVQCLGVKLAMYEDTDREDYERRIRGHYATDFPMVAATPSCARKLVEDAVAYAGAIGFAPHQDLKKAARVFGGVKANECSKRFTFGRDGKPYYVRGPRETEERARRIVEHLAHRLGEGNFEFLIMLGDGPGPV